MSRVRVATSVTLACLVLAGCPSSRGNDPTHPSQLDDRALRITAAKAEARREDGVRELTDLLRTGDLHAKQLALRGLGRIGGAAARSALVATLLDPDPELVASAMAAIGVAHELDEVSIEDGAALVPTLHAAFARTTGPGRLLAIEALGRAGDQRSQAILIAQFEGETPEVELAAGIALARLGRRKIALTDDNRAAVIAAAHGLSAKTRYGAVYALARAFVPPQKPVDPVMPVLLVSTLSDVDPAIRAQVILALVKHGGVSTDAAQIERALLDRDWRVAVEAVRALTGDQATPSGPDAVAVAIVRRIAEIDAGDGGAAQVVIEGLRGLQKFGARPAVAQVLIAIQQWATASTAPELTRAWIGCLTTAAQVRGANTGLDLVAGCKLPDHLRLPIVADLVTANVGTLVERRTALAKLIVHPDVRVRAAGLGALAAPWKEGSEGDHASAIGILVGALASPDPIVAGAAIDAAGAFYEAIGTGDHSAIDGAVVARAAIEKDPDLSGALLELIGKQKLAAGADACRAGVAGVPARAKAARGCLRALGDAVPETPTAHAPPPPVDVATVIGASLEWHLVTTRGELVIELRPDVAPWAVASIVALTTHGNYDGQELHRVVPDFVAQGGDPTESGAGGPGYSLPAEPGTMADGPGFEVGGVGMADAGKDSGGSQWFVMHTRAAHLDGRYTWVGTLRSGQKSADALLIGDKVVKATISIRSGVTK
jgi:cyclophilin family peptidyl-prolyl cis-trans isomerase/HEAT repeat protein